MDVKIVINIGDNKIKLTPGEAMELKQVLNDMYRNEYVYYPTWPQYPLQPLQPLSPSYDQWIITCGGTS